MLISLRTLHQRACLGAVALMLTVPFLMAHHKAPIPSFFQEWVTFGLSFLSLTALFHRIKGSAWEIPEIALLPLGLFLIAALQLIFQADALTDRVLLFACYAVWAFFLVILGRRLARIFGQEKLFRILATTILVGTLLEAVAAGTQALGYARLPWVFPHTVPGGLRGNLGQPNSLANYLWLGIGSALYLRSRSWMNIWWTAASLFVLLCFGALSGSRSVWLYAPGLTLLAYAWTWRIQDDVAKRLRRWSIYILLGGMIIQGAFSSGLIPLPDSIITAGSRVANQGSHDPIRIALWRTAVTTFLENPWLGAGFGQFTWQFHQHILDVMPLRLPGLAENAHNILLNLLAELGLGAGLLLLVLGGRWAADLAQGERSLEKWWLAAIALVLGIHSNLEYPLWYGFFLAIAALVAGAGSNRNFVPTERPILPWALAIGLVIGSVVSATMYRDFSLIEDLYYGRLENVRSPEDYRVRAGAMLTQLADSKSILRSYAALGASSLLNEDTSNLDAKLDLCNRAQRFSASGAIVFRCAYLLAAAGHQQQARLDLLRAISAYPDKAETVLDQWRIQRAEDPVIATLLADFPPMVR